jgi:uncharacterized membrane protein HdeD (DUF308 family)
MQAVGSTWSAPPTPWWLLLLEGIAALIIGILLLTETGVTLYTIILFVGAYWFVTGIIDLVMMFVDHRQWGWKLFSGVIGIIAGLAVLRHPAWASVLIPTTLVWLLGFLGIVLGVASLVRSFMGGGWSAAILGVISILFGALLLFNTVAATNVLIYLVAIWAIIGGIFAIVASFWLRSHPEMERGAARQPVTQP